MWITTIQEQLSSESSFLLYVVSIANLTFLVKNDTKIFLLILIMRQPTVSIVFLLIWPWRVPNLIFRKQQKLYTQATRQSIEFSGKTEFTR